MTAVALGLYYLIAGALLGAAVWHSARQNARDAEGAFARLRAGLTGRTPSAPIAPLLPADGPGSAPPEAAAWPEPLAPLLERFAREYLDRPADRERLARSLTDALDAVHGTTGRG